jgi:hypothetical protein
MASNPPLFELWRHGSRRCLITPVEGEAPFLMKVHEADILVAEKAFDKHLDACVAAIEALRFAVERL